MNVSFGVLAAVLKFLLLVSTIVGCAVLWDLYSIAGFWPNYRNFGHRTFQLGAVDYHCGCVHIYRHHDRPAQQNVASSYGPG